MMARRVFRFGSRVSSASGAAASKPTNASRQKTMPCRAGWTPPSPGRNTETVLLSPALITSSAETNTMIAISIRPSATPTRVEIETPR